VSAALALPGSSQTFLLGFHEERGVESRLLATLLAELPVHERVGLNAGVCFSSIEHSGLSGLGFGASWSVADFWHLSLDAALQHEQWNDWQTGENRALVLASAVPLENLTAGAGLAWRATVFGADRYRLPFFWQSDVAEFNLLYRLEWRFLRRGRFDAAAFVSNVDLLQVRNPQQFPFGLSGSYRFAPGFTLNARCASAINGLSGLLISANEITAELGVKHGF